MQRQLTNIQNIAILFALVVGLSACNHSDDNDDTTTMDTNDATYTVIFNSTWSETTHPDNFPGNPHFSGVIGATHNMNVELWKVGELSSSGVKSVAETGSKTLFQAEINQQISVGDADQLISESGINPSPGELSFEVTLQTDYTFITLLSMLAPSPDWIVGVASLNLMENGVWIESETVDLFVYDAGTDDGTTYTAADIEADPKQAIARIETAPFLVNSSVTPIGTLQFTKQ